jgi:hypothetical protein
MSRRALAKSSMVVVAALLGASPAAAIDINGYTPARHDRFSSGYPTAPVANTSAEFIGGGYDWSGVGWYYTNDNKSFALLGPQHFVYANHFAPGLGGIVRFTPVDGEVVGFGVASLSGPLPDAPSGGDLAIATLSAPIPDNIAVHPYSILFLGYSPSAYVGLDLLQYGFDSPPNPSTSTRIGWNEIDSVYEDAAVPGMYYFEFKYDDTTPDRTHLIQGDSGSPSFVTTGQPGEMYLVGIHNANILDLAGNTVRGRDTMLPLMLPQINQLMAETGYLPSVTTPITATWTGRAGSGAWNLLSNWSPGKVPADVFNGTGTLTSAASVLFDADTASRHAITINTPAKVTGMTFRGSASTDAFVFSGSGTLTLGEAGIKNEYSTPVTFGNPISLRTSQRWDVGSGGLIASGPVDTGSSTADPLLLVIDGSGDTLLGGLVHGTGSLAKHGSGALTFTGSQSWGDGASVLVKGGTLKYDFTSPAQIGIGNSITVDPGALLELSGSIPALSDGNHYVDVTVDGTLLVSGANQQIGNLVVSGTLVIGGGSASPPVGGAALAGADLGTDAAFQAPHGTVMLVPEPGSLALLLSGALLVLLARRRRRRRQRLSFR